ncbi:MAG: hypothetical protein ACK5PP_19390 [Acidimicrobiales bacterium]
MLSRQRLFTERRLLAGVDLLSLDVFDVALRRMVMEPEDVHRLVGELITDGDVAFTLEYPELRLKAEAVTRARHGDGCRSADIADQLARALDQRTPGSGAELARRAVQCELEIEQLLIRPDPGAIGLYRQAMQAGIRAVFVADTPLPRDLVARMLSGARYRPDHLLVTSHEGRDVADLLEEVISHSHPVGNHTLHLTSHPVRPAEPPADQDPAVTGTLPVVVLETPAPDADTDTDTDAGRPPRARSRRGPRGDVTVRVVPEARRAARRHLVLGFTPRSGLDSIAFALAADRMESTASRAGLEDLGYTMGGPLICGYAVWVAAEAARRRVGHLVFHRPTAHLVSRVVEMLGVPAVEAMSISRSTARRLDQPDVAPGTHLLTVDLWAGAAWTGAPAGTTVGQLALGQLPDSSGAPVPAGPSAGTPRQTGMRATTWAFGWPTPGHPVFDPVAETASRAVAVLELLAGIGPASTDPGPDPVLDKLAAGIIQFAADLQPWVRLGCTLTTAAMIEPALRLADRPRPSEARLLAAAAVQEPGSGRIKPLIDVVDDDTAPLWPAGQRLLSAVPARRGPMARIRRLRGRSRGAGEPPTQMV